MRVLISGASGLIGSALTERLRAGGDEVVPLVRTAPREGENAVYWNPVIGSIDAAGLEGMDAVVHLAGENIGRGRWTEKRKRRFRDSRVGGTRLLCKALEQLRQPPEVLVCASAIGFYGDRGEEELDETAAGGKGFLAGLVREWEESALTAREYGIRVVLARLGVVLSPKGGALAKQLLPFKLGLGGRLGSGRQYVSWIGLDDVAGAIHHGLQCAELEGPVNVAGPEPVTNAEFTRTLGRVLKRPAFMGVPAFALRLLLGREMADELLLASARVTPAKLLGTGYRFEHVELEGVLRHLLKG